MFLYLSGEITGGITRTHYGNVTNVKRSVFLQLDEYDAVGDEQEVIDNKGKNGDEPVAVKRIFADEELSGKQCQPREEDSLGQSNDLVYWRGRQVRVDSKQRQHHGPHGENDCEQPEVFREPQDSVPLQVHQLTEAVGKIETGRGQNKINEPQIHGEDSFSLIDHL